MVYTPAAVTQSLADSKYQNFVNTNFDFITFTSHRREVGAMTAEQQHKIHP